MELNLMQRLVLVVLPSPPRSSRLDDQGLVLVLLCAFRAWCWFHDGGHAWHFRRIRRLGRRPAANAPEMLYAHSESEAHAFTNITAHYSVLSAM